MSFLEQTYLNIAIIYLVLISVVLTFWRLIDKSFQQMQQIENGRAAEVYMKDIANVLKDTQSYLWYIEGNNVLLGTRFFENNNLRERPLPISLILRCMPAVKRRELQYMVDCADEEGQNMEIELYMPHQGKYHLLSLHVCKSEDGHTMGLFTVIDNLRKQEEELKRAFDLDEENKLKSSFLASMGHELRTPVNVISGFSRLIAEQRNELDPEEMKGFSNIIEENTEQLLKLLNDVLTAKADEDKVQLSLKPRKAADLVESLYTTHLVVIPSRLEFKLEKGDKADVVNVNRSSMMQIVSNLINNAVKFTPSGSITLGWESDEKWVYIYVRDTGCGITEEKKDKIFDKYFKENIGTAGAGIGLSLCLRLMQNMGGTITVDSEVGKGSCFKLVFPRG